MNHEELNSPQNQEERIVLTRLAIQKLDSLRKWAMFFAILGFIFIGLTIISMITFSVTGITAASMSKQIMGEVPFTLFSTIYLIFMAIAVVIYFFPVLYMYRFAVRTKRAILENSSESFELAIKALNAHFQFVGILTIIFLSLYLLVMAIAFIFGSMMN